MRHYAALFGLLCLLSACAARHPLGIGDAEWQEMSPEQQLQAHVQQAEQDHWARERREAAALAQQAEQQRQQEVLVRQRQQAAYGKRVQCILDDAEGRLGGKWRRIEPLALDLVTGMAQEVRMTSAAQRLLRYNGIFHAGFDGMEVSLCRDTEIGARGNPCARLLATQQEYQHGVSRKIEVDRLLRGNLRCQLVTPASRRRSSNLFH